MHWYLRCKEQRVRKRRKAPPDDQILARTASRRPPTWANCAPQWFKRVVRERLGEQMTCLWSIRERAYYIVETLDRPFNDKDPETWYQPIYRCIDPDGKPSGWPKQRHIDFVAAFCRQDTKSADEDTQDYLRASARKKEAEDRRQESEVDSMVNNELLDFRFLRGERTRYVSVPGNYSSVENKA